jgi:hypothetical protein
MDAGETKTIMPSHRFRARLTWRSQSFPGGTSPSPPHVQALVPAQFGTDGTNGALILRTVTQKDLTHCVPALPGELVGSPLPNPQGLRQLYRIRFCVARSFPPGSPAHASQRHQETNPRPF